LPFEIATTAIISTTSAKTLVNVAGDCQASAVHNPDV
jgi:hypothetical protein